MCSNIQTYLCFKVMFEDLVGEPDQNHTPDCAYKCGFDCYNLCLGLCYKIIAILCTWCIGMCFGCAYAYTTFCHIWAIIPCFKLCDICIGHAKRCLTIYFDCFCTPCCTALGSFFSQIKVTQNAA